MKRNVKSLFICQGAIIAAIYVVLTYAARIFGLDAGVIQLRISEALCVLPALTSAAIPGLYLGCLLANLLSGAMWLDVLFGPIATLLGALGAYALRRHKWLVPLPTVAANTLIIPFVLAYGYGAQASVPVLMLTVGVGECLGAYVFGMCLLCAICKRRKQIFF